MNPDSGRMALHAGERRGRAGPVVFYTRLKAPADTAVEHRWLRGDRLQQKMTLRIRANPGAGYRTYSRATVGAGLQARGRSSFVR